MIECEATAAIRALSSVPNNVNNKATIIKRYNMNKQQQHTRRVDLFLYTSWLFFRVVLFPFLSPVCLFFSLLLVAVAAFTIFIATCSWLSYRFQTLTHFRALIRRLYIVSFFSVHCWWCCCFHCRWKSIVSCFIKSWIICECVCVQVAIVAGAAAIFSLLCVANHLKWARIFNLVMLSVFFSLSIFLVGPEQSISNDKKIVQECDSR